MRADEAFHLEQYYAAPRHTIQIDFGRYCVDLMKEIEAGQVRARRATGERRVQLLDGGDRPLADEAAADVRRRPAVDRRAPGQQGYVVARAVRLDHHRAGCRRARARGRRAPDPPGRPPRPRADRRAAASGRRPATSRRSAAPARPAPRPWPVPPRPPGGSGPRR